MSNTNSVAGFAQSGTLRNQFPTQVVNAATETALLVNTDTGTTAAILLAPSGGNVYGSKTGLDVNANPAIISRSGREYGLPSGETNDQFSSSSWDGRLFYVRLVGIGNAAANASQTVLFNLYQGTATSVIGTAGNIVANTGAAYAMVAGGAFNFFVEAELQWDAASQILSGGFTANIAFGTGQQFTVTKATAHVLSGITASGLSFLPSVTFAVAGATNTVTVREFVIEKI